MTSKRRDCRLMKCMTVLHGGVYHRTSTPHKSGNKTTEKKKKIPHIALYRFLMGEFVQPSSLTQHCIVHVSYSIYDNMVQSPHPWLVVVPVVISNGLRSANVYVTLADVAYCMHIHIFNKVAVAKNYECQKYETNHRFMRMRTRT